VKTTTFVTLLVAAAMVLSGAVTGISMMMNEKTTTMEVNTGKTVQLGSEDENAVAFEPAMTEQNIGTAEEYTNPIREDRQCVIWDNGMFFNDGWTAQTDQCTYDGEPADDFEFDYDAEIMDIHFIILFISDYIDYDYVITFYEDDGSGDFPGAVHAGPFTVDTVDVYVGDLFGYPAYEMSTDIVPSVFCDANTKYWVSIQADGPCYPRTFWGMHSGSTKLSQAVFRSNYFTGGTWRTSTYMLGQPFDMAFQLTVKPEHDVGVTEIKHPQTCDTPGCPCIPVEVEVTNFGQNDEFDVPVHIEIHRNIWSSSFELPDDEFMWNFDGMGICNWQFVTDETWFPYKVEPNKGDWMMEFNQHDSVWCEAEVISHEPVYVCGDCIDPYLKFYMWHDDYGSDDYIDVWVSTNGKYGDFEKIGGPYERLCCPECPIGWLEHRISLEEFICQPIWIKFIGHSDGTPSAYNLHIDDVTVFDLEYVCETTVDLEAGETKQVECECWDTSCWWCQYENEDVEFWVGAWTEMEGDEIPDNDGFGPCQNEFRQIFIHIPWTHDVGDKEIEYPDKDYYMADEAPIKKTENQKLW
jgi:hypothetical protein